MKTLSCLERISLVFTIFCCCLSRYYIQGAPTASASAIVSGIDYLAKYGYLVRNDPKNGQIMSQSNLVQSIQDLQKFAGLNVTGVLDAATISLMGTRRCGMPDVSPADNARRKRRYTLHGTYWTKKDLTYRIKGYSGDLGRSDQERIYKWAFGLWSQSSKIKVTEAPSGVPDEKVDILINFYTGYHGDGYPFDGAGGTLAHAFYPHNNKGIAGDAHFDDGERYTTGRSDGINLDWVALHEFGHSLGLDHSTVRGSIMFPWYQGYKKNIKLTRDDIQGIQKIYGSPTGVIEPTDETFTRPKHSGPTKKPLVDECKLPKYDAWLYSKEEDTTYAFIGEHYFEVNPHTVGVIKGPLKIIDKWSKINKPINAAYIRADGRTVFFSEKTYWIYFGSYYEQGPRPIKDFGLPSELAKMDGVFVWGRNLRTYFFKGSQYWRFDERTRKIDSGYPRQISVWRKIPNNIDSVMKWRNGKTYFFKGSEYYKLDDYSIQAEVDYPKSIALKWMRCDQSRLAFQTTIRPTTNSSSTANATVGDWDKRSSNGITVLPTIVMILLSALTAAKLY